MKNGDVIELSYPDELRIVKNGKEYVFYSGVRYTVSTKCDPENKIASLDGKKLIHKNFAKSIENQITKSK